LSDNTSPNKFSSYLVNYPTPLPRRGAGYLVPLY
jgi:hypothetical protein